MSVRRTLFRILFVGIQITGERSTRPTSRTTSDIVKSRYNNMNSELHTIHITIGRKKNNCKKKQFSSIIYCFIVINVQQLISIYRQLKQALVKLDINNCTNKL